MDDIDRLYISRKEGRGRLVSIEDSVDASIRRLKDFIRKRNKRLITKTKKKKKTLTKQGLTEKNDWKKWEAKNNCLDILSYKQATINI